MRYSPSKMAAFATATLAIVLMQLAFCEVAAATNRNTSLDNEHITNGPIAEYLADTRAEIGWSTRGSAQMAMRYGTDPDHMEQVVEAVGKSRGRCHHARIEGLKPNTTYYFQVLGEDKQPDGELGTFQTLGAGAPPVTRKVIVP